MYCSPDSFSPRLRQGDILVGRAIVGPDVQVKRLHDLREAIESGRREYPLEARQKIRDDHYMILSQCCDLDDRRILVAPLMSDAAVATGELDSQAQEAFKNNQLGVIDEGESAGTIVGVDALGEELSRVRLVYPGYFYLKRCDGVFDEPKVVAFNLARGVRDYDLRLLTKVAELCTTMRWRLRQRLAVCFGRIPEEDVR